MTLHHQALRYAVNINAKQFFLKLAFQAADFGKF
jgi:hypothetical protein